MQKILIEPYKRLEELGINVIKLRKLNLSENQVEDFRQRVEQLMGGQCVIVN